MVFLNIFLKTLGFFIGISTFVILLSFLLSYIEGDRETFELARGTENSNNVIATLRLNGPIINNYGDSFFDNIGDYIDPDNVKKKLNKLKIINPNILIIKINSPGGTVSASANLENIISKFNKENEIDIYFYSDEILASGGYWVATSGDKIYANYGSIVGSIGVSGPSWYYFDQPTSISTGILGKNIETKNGIKIFNQSAGNSKDLYNPFRKPTTKEINHLQNIVEEIYNDFILKVSKSRKIEINTIKNEISALIYTGKQAKKNFLIDDILNYNELIEKIIKDKKYDDYKLIEMYSKRRSLIKYFGNYFEINDLTICNKLNSNFVSILPLTLKNC